MRDLERDDAQIASAITVIAHAAPDVLVLTDFDFDHDAVALDAFRRKLSRAGLALAHQFAGPTNSGLATGEDMDGNGRLGEARDAQGYGRFAGDGGIAIISRWPIGPVADFTTLLWRDLPGATLPPMTDAVRDIQRLSSTAHWIVPVKAPGGQIDLLVFDATPPVFDGPEDRNGLRNRDELRLWQLVLDGHFGPPPDNFVFAGNANLDPADGEGLREAMATFLRDPRLTDPQPSSSGARAAADASHIGDPSLDTADWPGNGPGNLRVSYVLPARSFEVLGAGVVWPDPDQEAGQSDDLSEAVRAAGPHRLVWVDLGW